MALTCVPHYAVDYMARSHASMHAALGGLAPGELPVHVAKGCMPGLGACNCENVVDSP